MCILLFFLKGDLVDAIVLWYYIYDFFSYCFGFIVALISPLKMLLPNLELDKFVFVPFFEITPLHAPIDYPKEFNVLYDAFYQVRIWFLYWFPFKAYTYFTFLFYLKNIFYWFIFFHQALFVFWYMVILFLFDKFIYLHIFVS